MVGGAVKVFVGSFDTAVANISKSKGGEIYLVCFKQSTDNRQNGSTLLFADPLILQHHIILYLLPWYILRVPGNIMPGRRQYCTGINLNNTWY